MNMMRLLRDSFPNTPAASSAAKSPPLKPARPSGVIPTFEIKRYMAVLAACEAMKDSAKALAAKLSGALR